MQNPDFVSRNPADIIRLVAHGVRPDDFLPVNIIEIVQGLIETDFAEVSRSAMPGLLSRMLTNGACHQQTVPVTQLKRTRD